MAIAKDFVPNLNHDQVIEDKLQRAVAEIYATWGHKVKISRKSLNKFGLAANVTTTLQDIASFNSATNPTYTFAGADANPVDSISASNSADSNLLVRLEGMVRSGNDLTFKVIKVRTHPTDGQIRVPLVDVDDGLTYAFWDCMRTRGKPTGSVWIYENTPTLMGKPINESKINNELVDVGRNASLKASTSIAASNYMIMLYFNAGVGRGAGSSIVEIELRKRLLNDPDFGEFESDVIAPFSVVAGGAPAPKFDYLIWEPNSRVETKAIASAGTVPTRASFWGCFADIE